MLLLVEVDKLIQLLESPIFTYLRLQLLEPQQHAYLVKALYGLLMILPQSRAYVAWSTRPPGPPVFHVWPHHNHHPSPTPTLLIVSSIELNFAHRYTTLKARLDCIPNIVDKLTILEKWVPQIQSLVPRHCYGSLHHQQRSLMRQRLPCAHPCTPLPCAPLMCQGERWRSKGQRWWARRH